MLKTLRNTLFIAGTISSSALLMPGLSYGIGLTVLAPGNFTTIANQSSPSVTGVATAGGTLNTTALDTGNTRTVANQVGGFGGFFASDFVSVGGLTNTTIGGSVRRQNSAAQSQTFTLGSASLAADLVLKFDFIFAGYIGPSASSNFVIQLADSLGNTENFASTTLINSNPQPPANNGRFQSTSGIDQIGIISAANLALFAPGNFTVQIVVDEPFSSTPTNTVAGFNNISIQTVPYEFEAIGGIGLLGLFFGVKKVRKNLKAKNKNA